MFRRILVNVKLLVLVFSIACIALVPARTALAGKAEHVVVVVWDGLRPDCVNEVDTPTLLKLSKSGVFFANHHAVFPSSTEVNGAALATGGYPGHNGLMANHEYRPDIELLHPLNTESEYTVWHGDRLRGGLFIQLPTLAEIVRKAGRRTAVAGTKPVALLWDRAERDAAQAGNGTTLYEGQTIPSASMDGIRKTDGPIPPTADPKKTANVRADQWTTGVLTKRLWAGGVPAFSLLWLSEPDYAQHGSGPGTKVAKAALKSCDDNLARVLAALDEAKVRDKTDVLVVSDHGFSTVLTPVDLADDLKKAKLNGATSFGADPAAGDILVVGLGGGVSFYVVGHDEAVIAKAVEALQKSASVGVIFTRKGLPGTFALSQVGIDTADAPDILVSLRWYDDTSAVGLPGLLACQGSKYVLGQGIHASLSRYDMHNTLIAAGPDLRAGLVDELPSGNADVAPTLLRILGIPNPGAMDGRVLGEALVDGPAAEGKPETTTLEARQKAADRTWRQYLKVTKLGKQTYYDEGNGGVVLEK